MPDLEKFISEHEPEFETFEPDPGHFKRFKSRLEEQHSIIKPGHNRSVMLKVAALILILISISVFLFEFASREISNMFSSAKPGTELPLEISEALQYYDNQATVGLGTLRRLTASNPETISLSVSALKEIRDLDAATADLKIVFSSNPGNEHILDAIIRNQRMKESILNNIINQISQSVK